MFTPKITGEPGSVSPSVCVFQPPGPTPDLTEDDGVYPVSLTSIFDPPSFDGVSKETRMYR